ncbi:exo-alpha-sialidase [Actinoplanes sp. N902-109]|uniref:sialidase family protein n=1 Tax=Actinoplanes sp. (strain N902-109) TaxID=649831 RepID=UPI0003295FEA|nr:sialidase family protein [Actinoplanes sp. N902-109]AGL17168.1 glycoside hydrolase family protein [Actinoplanes sp. N902-109]
MTLILRCLVALSLIVAGPSKGPQQHSETLLFDGGGETLNGTTYHSFRIPSLLRTTKDSLLAFAEGRTESNRDHGNINLMVKRSTDDGATWSGLGQVVGTGQGTWGNPTAVVDRDTGTIFLFVSWNAAGLSQDGADGTTRISAWGERRVRLFTSSKDEDGTVWHGPADLTEAVTPRKHADGSDWAWDAVGPGAGIQTSSGRLLVPATNRTIYSDDHGKTFHSAPMARGQEVTGESTLLELTDGRLMRNDTAVMSTWETAKNRWVARGTIEGGFDAYAPDPHLPDPHAEASILRYNLDTTPRIIFLNSASSVNRRAMTIRVSTDEGVTWPVSRRLSDAPMPAWPQLGSANVVEGGYSSLAKTANKQVGALVEVNENADASDTSHRSIVFRTMNLPWITG